ncbi:MAG: hypothetical protein AB7N76_14285 [Planctomycetota bacterium]
MELLLALLRSWGAALGTAACAIVLLVLVQVYLRKRRGSGFAAQLASLGLALVAVVAVVAVLPLNEEVRGQLLEKTEAELQELEERAAEEGAEEAERTEREETLRARAERLRGALEEREGAEAPAAR